MWLMWQIALSVLFVGYGAVTIVRCILLLVSAWESRRWPVAEGVMISVLYKGPFGDGILCRLRVSYKFTVQGEELVGRRAYFGDRFWTKWTWWFGERIDRKYPSGARVKVYYNPRHPEDAVLDPGLNWTLIRFFLFGIALFAMGIMLLRSAP